MWISLKCETDSAEAKIIWEVATWPQILHSDINVDLDLEGLPTLSGRNNRYTKGLANQLYLFVTAQVQWAVENGVIVGVENLQFSFFWATTFWQQVAHLLEYSLFHSCQCSSQQQKKTMVAFNVNQCSLQRSEQQGQTRSLGIQSKNQGFRHIRRDTGSHPTSVHSVSAEDASWRWHSVESQQNPSFGANIQAAF